MPAKRVPRHQPDLDSDEEFLPHAAIENVPEDTSNEDSQIPGHDENATHVPTAEDSVELDVTTIGSTPEIPSTSQPGPETLETNLVDLINGLCAEAGQGMFVKCGVHYGFVPCEWTEANVDDYKTHQRLPLNSETIWSKEPLDTLRCAVVTGTFTADDAGENPDIVVSSKDFTSSGSEGIVYIIAYLDDQSGVERWTIVLSDDIVPTKKTSTTTSLSRLAKLDNANHLLPDGKLIASLDTLYVDLIDNLRPPHYYGSWIVGSETVHRDNASDKATRAKPKKAGKSKGVRDELFSNQWCAAAQPELDYYRSLIDSVISLAAMSKTREMKHVQAAISERMPDRPQQLTAWEATLLMFHVLRMEGHEHEQVNITGDEKDHIRNTLKILCQRARYGHEPVVNMFQDLTGPNNERLSSFEQIKYIAARYHQAVSDDERNALEHLRLNPREIEDIQVITALEGLAGVQLRHKRKTDAFPVLSLRTSRRFKTFKSMLDVANVMSTTMRALHIDEWPPAVRGALAVVLGGTAMDVDLTAGQLIEDIPGDIVRISRAHHVLHFIVPCAQGSSTMFPLVGPDKMLVVLNNAYSAVNDSPIVFRYEQGFLRNGRRIRDKDCISTFYAYRRRFSPDESEKIRNATVSQSITLSRIDSPFAKPSDTAVCEEISVISLNNTTSAWVAMDSWDDEDEDLHLTGKFLIVASHACYLITGQEVETGIVDPPIRVSCREGRHHDGKGICDKKASELRNGKLKVHIHFKRSAEKYLNDVHIPLTMDALHASIRDALARRADKPRFAEIISERNSTTPLDAVPASGILAKWTSFESDLYAAIFANAVWYRFRSALEPPHAIQSVDGCQMLARTISAYLTENKTTFGYDPVARSGLAIIRRPWFIEMAYEKRMGGPGWRPERPVEMIRKCFGREDVPAFRKENWDELWERVVQGLGRTEI